MGMFVGDEDEDEDEDEDVFQEEPEFVGFYDLIGEYHDEGLGWNPNGVWCGECSSLTCEKCQHRFDVK